MRTYPSSPPNQTQAEPAASVALTLPASSGELEMAGRRYVTADRLASALGISTRTLGRWEAVRIGPPKIKIGKLVLFDLAKVPEWLASRETEPVRAAAGRR